MVTLTLTAIITVYVYAAFVEPLAGPADSDQDFVQNILGANNADNDFAAYSIAANNNGSIIEREQYIAGMVDNNYSACYTYLPYDTNSAVGLTCSSLSCPGYVQVTTFSHTVNDYQPYGTVGSTGNCTAIVCCLAR